VPPPEIFVKTTPGDLFPRYAAAHLRNKAGYVYLTWRDGERVRSFYLGKAPRKYPTTSSSSSSPAPAARPPDPELRRRVKKPA
jgi:hypothetical protein